MKKNPLTCVSCDRTEDDHGFDGNIATHTFIPGESRGWLKRELEATKKVLADLTATLPKCQRCWGRMGKVRARIATCGPDHSIGYMWCDDCLPSGYVADTLEWAPIVRQLENDGVLPCVNDSSPEDLRAAGWSVAVHNDYKLDGEHFTFWLFTRNGRCVKGEGRTDAEALIEVRKAIAKSEEEEAADG